MVDAKYPRHIERKRRNVIDYSSYGNLKTNEIFNLRNLN